MESKNNQIRLIKPQHFKYNPENINPYDYEVDLLEEVKSEWNKIPIGKTNAQELKTKLGIFLHVFSNRYRIAVNFYQKNIDAGLNFYDAKEYLETYSKSKAISKYNNYFYDGKDEAIKGIQYLIDQLKSEKVE